MKMQNFKTMSCTKTKFATKDFAEFSLKKIAKTNTKVKPIRSYYCEECKCWHLTKNVDSKDYSKLIQENKTLKTTIIKLNEQIKLLEKTDTSQKIIAQLNKQLEEAKNRPSKADNVQARADERVIELKKQLKSKQRESKN
ncbi:MAG: hypothetical protein HC892_14435 [Saprospiraceae bacterium]|nr:hypothetical protein [Saprospiraceae bacterium]